MNYQSVSGSQETEVIVHEFWYHMVQIISLNAVASRRMGSIMHLTAESHLNQGMPPRFHVGAYKITSITQVIRLTIHTTGCMIRVTQCSAHNAQKRTVTRVRYFSKED